MPKANPNDIATVAGSAPVTSNVASRRGLPIAAPAVTLPAIDPDADLLGACQAFFAADEDWEAAEGNAVTGAAADRWYAALTRVTDTHACTQAGAMAKARVALAAMMSLDGDDLAREARAALSALADVVGMAEAGARPEMPAAIIDARAAKTEIMRLMNEFVRMTHRVTALRSGLLTGPIPAEAGA